MTGTLDLAAHLEVSPTIEGTELLYARSQVGLAAANARVDRLDGPYTVPDDTEGLRQSCAASRILGFSGRVVLHAGQLDTVNSADGLSDRDRRSAEEIIATCRGAGADAGGSLRSPGGDFIDAPVLARAARYLGIDVQDVYRWRLLPSTTSPWWRSNRQWPAPLATRQLADSAASAPRSVGQAGVYVADRQDPYEPGDHYDPSALVRHTPVPGSREGERLVGAPQLGAGDGDPPDSVLTVVGQCPLRLPARTRPPWL